MTEAHDIGACWRALRQSPVRAPVWLWLVRAYVGAGLRWQAAYAARQVLRLNPGAEAALSGLDIGA